MSREEFDGRPLVADSIVGVREFDVDSLGRLRGVTYAHVWTPGVNEAECSSSRSDSSRSLSVHLTRMKWAFATGSPIASNDIKVDDALAEDEPKKHQTASLNCTCGFYAYTDTDDRAYSTSDRVTGIVRGSGVATVGSRGFRVERAEIVALINPRPKVAPLSWVARRWNQFSAWASEHDTAAMALGIIGSIVGIVAAPALMAGVSAWFAPLLALTFAGPIFLGGMAHGDTMSYSRRPASRTPDLDLVRRNYAGIPVYPSLKAALKDHPLSTPPPPAEPSPSDEDFWTRSAR
jgi:hypothetical protein